MARAPTKPPLPLLLGFGAFLLVVAYLLAASFVRPRVAEFAPTPMRPSGGPAPQSDTVTIDAQRDDQWHFFAFDRGPLADTIGWDLAVRRYHVVTSGAAADAGLGERHGPRGATAPAFQATTFARDTVNPVLDHWYRYSFVTHLLSPNGHGYWIRTRTGRVALIEFLSYYCPGSTPGCVTFRYVYPAAAPQTPGVR